LVGATIDVGTHELFGRRVGHGPHCDVGCGETTHVSQRPRDSEVGQQDPPLAVVGIGEQDVARLDIAMQKAALVRVVQRSADGGRRSGPQEGL
jgi:hypothetical protein